MRKTFPGGKRAGSTRVKMAAELKWLCLVSFRSRYGYKCSIPSLAGTENKRIEPFIKLIVEELKSCGTLTGEAKEKVIFIINLQYDDNFIFSFEELNRLSKELSVSCSCSSIVV